MSVSLKADLGGSIGSIQLNGADRLLLNADGTLSGTANPATGLRSGVLATMQKFTDEFSSSLGVIGWQKLPSGLILQWGLTAQTTTSLAVTYPIAFPTANLWVGTQDHEGQPALSLWSYNRTGLTGMTVYAIGTLTKNNGTFNAPTSAGCQWFAIGY